MIECLQIGWSDFWHARTYRLVFSAFYALCGVLLVSALFAFGLSFLIFPVIAGFLLLGPLLVVGLYEVSRRVETGEDLALRPIALCFMRHGGKQLMLFGALLVFIMVIWLKAALLLYALTFGLRPTPLSNMLASAATDGRVGAFLIAGNGIGAVLAALVFSISVIGLPYLLDRDVDFITAATTSIRAVLESKLAMLVWAMIIGAMLLISVATGFLGLLIALPVAGHPHGISIAEWWMYPTGK